MSIPEQIAAKHTAWGVTGPDIYGDLELECHDCGELLAPIAPHTDPERDTVMRIHIAAIAAQSTEDALTPELEALRGYADILADQRHEALDDLQEIDDLATKARASQSKYLEYVVDAAVRVKDIRKVTRREDGTTR